MAQRPRYNQKRHKSSRPPRAAMQREPSPVYEKKLPVQYGKAFVVMEDPQRNTFEFAQGAWVPFELSIAQCRQDCQVKELPQKVGGMTRYEVRRPEPLAT